MRCFIAVDLDSKLVAKVTALQNHLLGLDTKIVEPENLHFTLKFLGEVDVNTLNEVRSSLINLLKNYEPFEISIEGTGVFPSEHFIRVVWTGAGKLAPLQEDINGALTGLFPREKPVPHLTLARVRSQDHRTAIMDFVKRHKDINIGIMKVDKVKIKKSVLTPKGPVYEDTEVLEL